MGEREIPIEVIGSIDDDGDETENLKELADVLNTHANSGISFWRVINRDSKK